MIFRKFSLILSKYLAIALCLITVLLTTPWGSHLTVVLLNNIDGITLDYHSGSLVRDVQLNSLHLQLDNLDISVKNLSTEINFACTWKKLLCVKSAKADYFALDYQSYKEQSKHKPSSKNPADNKLIKKAAKKAAMKTTKQALFIMPFAIEAESIELKESHLVINDSDISIDQFAAQLFIDKSEFKIVKPNAQKLSWLVDNSEKITSPEKINTTDSINKTFKQLPEVHLPIALLIDKLHINTIEIRQKNHPDNSCSQACSLWLSTNNHLSGSWRRTDVNITDLRASTDNFTINELTADVKLQPPYQINSHSTSQHHKVSWWPEVANSNAQLSLKGSLEDLAIELSTQGNLAIAIQGDINLIDENMPFKVSMNGQKIPTPLSLSHIGEYSSLSLLLSGDLEKQAIEFTSQITGYGYSDANISIKAERQAEQINIEHFFFNDNESSSQLDLAGKIAVLPDDISWQLSADSSGFTFPEADLQALTEIKQKIADIDYLAQNLPNVINGRLQGRLNSKGKWAKDTWSVSLSDTDVSGHINDLPFTLQANIGLNQSGKMQAGKLFVDFNESTLTLRTTTDSFWGMTGQLSVEDINHWHGDIYGGFITDFAVSGQQNNPMIKLKTQLTELSWHEWASTLLVIEADYQPMKDHQLQLTVNNDQVRWQKDDYDYNIDNLLFTVQGDASEHKVKALWLGDSTGDIALSGHFDETFNHWQSTVEQSSLSYKNFTLDNTNQFAVEIDLSSQQAIVDSHCWRGNGLSVCLKNNATLGHSGDLAVNVDIDLAVIDELFLPQDTELISQVSGDINVAWSKQKAIAANAKFKISPGYLKVSDEFSQHKISQWSQSQLSFAVDEQQHSHNFVLMGIDDLPLVNINSSVQFNDDFDLGSSSIHSQIRLNNANLQPLQSILANVITLQGQVTADISIDGTIDSPLINGNALLDNGKLRLSQNANTLDNISSSMNIDKNKASIDGAFYLKDKEAKLQGNLSWQDSLAMNLDLTGAALPLVFPPQLIMAVSPALNFSLIEKSLTISGDIDVIEGIYNIEKLPESSVSLSDDVIIIDEQGKAIVKESTGFDIKTNINVNIEPAFEISGQGLQGHLFGQLQITQQEKHPFQMFGRIQSSKGTFQAYGQKLNIDKGELTFNGPLDNPYFNLRASRHIRAEDIDVGIQVTGLADALDMQLFSTPTMTTPEMLSYLVRGRSLDAGTENSTAAASLLVGFGATNSTKLFDRIEQIPLISNIAVDTEGEGEKTQATVSGYVGNRVYLKYGIGVYEPINELTVRMFILNRFWLEIVSGIEQSTDLYYSFYID